ncbi:MAG TPA: xanthine dehydrogenase family protein molybdopterin-binding subunit [Geminicoccaceae bacterium]
MQKYGIGQPMRRIEDQRFLTGRGSYADDVVPEGALHGFVLRSPLAHARITSLDVEAARAAPGVALVLTGHEIRRAGLKPIPCMAEMKGPDGEDLITRPERWPLQTEAVRHIGDGVAFVVAGTLAQARDAAELVEVDYEPLPAVVEVDEALAEGAPQIWAEGPGNQVFAFQTGDAEAVRTAFARAAHVVEVDLVNNRVMPTPIEPRACVASYDPEADHLTLRFSGQAVHGLQQQLATRIFGIPKDKLRLIAPDVGGGFGMKNFMYPEWVLSLFAARELGRAVRWVAERSEDFVSDTQARDQRSRVALALDEEHRFLALRVESRANLGAYLSTNGPMIPTRPSAIVMGGCYRIPAIDFRVTGAFTNTVPTDAYRGAGRPEAAYIIERLVDRAAAELGVDPAELRRKNFIAPADMPYRTALGQTLDSAEFANTMALALEKADRAGFEVRREDARARGRLRGLGLASYYEATLGIPEEAAELRFEADGMVSMVVGTQSNGQGLETGFAQIVGEVLGLPPERVRLVQGDTALVPTGGGHGGSRSTQLGGSALFRASEAVREKARELAAEDLEVAAQDLAFEDGTFRVVGTDREVGLLDLAARHRPNGASVLDARAEYTRESFTFPNGCHVCEVEVDPETGSVEVVRYTVADDFGRVINPLLVEGQVHGGIAQGIGQAMLEWTVYEDGSGQLLTGSLMDYALPRATDMPWIDFHLNEVPATNNPLGVKGCGEAGCVGALPAFVNGVLDALRPLGVESIDMPITREKVWRLIDRRRAA